MSEETGGKKSSDIVTDEHTYSRIVTSKLS